VKILRALVSVSNKEGIVDFVKVLRKQKIEIISTGGTSKLLEENNIKVMSVSDYTGFPEILQGRVKTLHPKIYGGLLVRRADPHQLEQLKEFGISEIHMVVINLYPFEQTIAKADCTLSDAIENIDIGGVSLIRAAAKNYQDVIVITDPKDYALILEEMNKNNHEISSETRMRLAVKAFSMTAAYDRHISNYAIEKYKICGMGKILIKEGLCMWMKLPKSPLFLKQKYWGEKNFLLIIFMICTMD